MERKHIRIRRDELSRLKFLKTEYHYIVLKTISKERMLKPTIRFYARTIIDKWLLYQSRVKNYCLLTGRGKGTTKRFNISRHMLNKLSQVGSVTNYSRNNSK